MHSSAHPVERPAKVDAITKERNMKGVKLWNLRVIRKSRGIVAGFMAKRMCVSYSSYSKWESGTSSPSSKEIDELAEFFGVTREQLLGEEPIALK